jgi:uncharacterized protein (TIGR03086 family)
MAEPHSTVPTARAALAGYERRLAQNGPEQWSWPTPCSAWDVRALTNHMVRGNRNYLALLAGGSRDAFLRLRDRDALGDDPLRAFRESVTALLEAFADERAGSRVLDHPWGPVTADRALRIRTVDSVLHTWDLARALGADERLDADLVRWVHENWDDAYADLVVPPFFVPPTTGEDTGLQESVLRRSGRTP